MLELVSSAMYVDPLTVYREYIQNAADAVDSARAAGLLAPPTIRLPPRPPAPRPECRVSAA